MGQQPQKSERRFLKKLKIELLYNPATPFLDIYPKELKAESCRVICIPMFTAASFTIAKKWTQSKCPSKDEWVKKMWYIHTMKYYSAFKKKEILSCATTWINLEDIMLSEISQSQKDIYHMIPFI